MRGAERSPDDTGIGDPLAAESTVGQMSASLAVLGRVANGLLQYPEQRQVLGHAPARIVTRFRFPRWDTPAALGSPTAEFIK